MMPMNYPQIPYKMSHCHQAGSKPHPCTHPLGSLPIETQKSPSNPNLPEAHFKHKGLTKFTS